MSAAHPARLLKLRAGQAFDYPTTSVGTSSDGLTTVYYDPSLGQPGLDLANGLVSAAPDLNAKCVAWFGIPCLPTNLIVAPLSGGNAGDGGAYHYGCDWASGGTLYVDAAFGNLPMDVGLFIAELTECFMGAAGTGWNCGGSGGEALSRWLAEQVSGGVNGALGGFSTAPSWDQAGRPNWVDSDQGSDQDYPSIGCGMVYISWMLSLGHTLDAIVQAGGVTLAANYKTLTGKTTAWADLTTALGFMNPGTITNDDPFAGAAPQPQPAPPPDPTPTPPPGPTPEPTGNVIDQILANPNFRAGVEAYQASHGLEADGRIGPLTLRQIDLDMEAAMPAPVGSGATQQQVDETTAMINNAVTDLQAALDVLSGAAPTSMPFP